MSRKHYQEIAEMLNHRRTEYEGRPMEMAALRSITQEMALIFKRNNRNFNAGKFFDAAGFPELTGTRMGLN